MKFERFGDIVKIAKGKKHEPAPKKEGRSFRYIQIDDLRNDNNLKYTDEKGTEVNENDLIIAWDGANAGTIGFGLRGMIGSTLARLRIKDEKEYSTDFIGYLLRSQNKFLRSKTTGATIPHISKNALESIKIPQLDLPEQYNAALVLKKSAALIEQRKHSIALLDEFLESTFLEMFGEPVSNKKSWNKLALKEVARIRIGPFGSLLHREDYVQGGVPLVNPSHIKKGKIEIDSDLTISKNKMKELSAYVMHEGDVVLARRGEIGRCAVVTKNEEGFLCGTGSIFIRPENGLQPIYLYNVISSASMRKVLENSAKGITMKNLNSGIVEELKIPVPPIKLQTQFANIVAKTEALKEKYINSLQKLENLFGSLSQLAFKGELKIKDRYYQYKRDDDMGDAGYGAYRSTEKTPLKEVSKEKPKKKFRVYSPFEEVSSVASVVSNYKPVLSDLHPFIRNHIKSIYFTFEELKQATIKAGWKYEYETLKNFVFELLRDGILKQVFGDVEFKAQFNVQHPEYKAIEKFTAQMYLRRVEDL